MAAAVGVSGSYINAIERGYRMPTATVVDRLLKAAGLDLVLAEPIDARDRDELVAHLRRSLTQRLRLGLGLSADLRVPATGPEWRELMALSRVGRIVIEPPLAWRLWLPSGRSTPVRVRVHQLRAELPHLEAVSATVSEAPPAASLVPVALVWLHRVWVAPPAELALDPVADRLRLADLLLHDEAARDDAGRRRPAHRDPDERAEG
jgi:transcriptional regulator with XRE-family HTH domain